MKQSLIVICVVALCCALCGAGAGGSVVSAAVATVTPPPLYELRVFTPTAQDVARLTGGGWDVLEARGRSGGVDYLLVMGDDSTAARLREQGFRVEIDHVVNTSTARAPFSYDGGYRTVAEHYQHMDDTVTLHPDLAVTVTYGVSWLKAQGNGGYDLRAICITKLQPGDCALNPGGKPRFFLMAAIHARELTTAELAWRWIDLLVNGYNVDPDITALLDSNEMWVVPVANPDGRAIVEQGGDAPYMQRKNTNNTLGSCSTPGSQDYWYNQPGVDLNRNANFQWGVSGASPFPCDQTYEGASAASEPEEQSLEALMTNLFGHQRVATDTNGLAAAPITATGVMLTLHSYSDLVLLPWGYTNTRTLNDASLRSLAFHMSYFNGYQTGQAPEVLYAASGASDDWAYGVLGLPGFTFEVGPLSGACSDFAPPYTCQDGTFWPLNQPAFLYAAKVARQPYALALGPTVSVPESTLVTPLSAGTVFTALAATDTLGNSGYGRPTPSTISAAEYSIDAPPWLTTSNPVSMSAVGGSFGAPEVTVSGTITAGLVPGRHLLYVHAQDANGDWGPITARWLLVPRYQLRLIAVYKN
ncbi:MAG: hypothetical protein M1434_08150 [Chloroflexi bacterium]|nr:hypothetical protein [Chloroflexota bacterium]